MPRVGAPVAAMAGVEQADASRKRAWTDAAFSASGAFSKSRKRRRVTNIEMLIHTGLLHLHHAPYNEKAAGAMFQRAWDELDETARGPRAKARTRRELSGLLSVCSILKAQRGEDKACEQELSEARRRLEAAAADSLSEGAEGEAAVDAACWMNCSGIAHLLSDDVAKAADRFCRAAQIARASTDVTDARSNAALVGLMAPSRPQPGVCATALAALKAAAEDTCDPAPYINLAAGMVAAGLPPGDDAWTTNALRTNASAPNAVLLNNVGVAQAAQRRVQEATTTLRRAALLPLADPSHVHFNHACIGQHDDTSAARSPAHQALPTLDEMVGANRYCAPQRLGCPDFFSARHVKPKPASGTAFRALGTARKNRGLLSEAVDIDPNDSAAWREWGMALLADGGDASDAVEYCKQACRRSDSANSPAALCALGTATHLNPTTAEGSAAERVYQRAIDHLDRQAVPPTCPVRYQVANNLANGLRYVCVRCGPIPTTASGRGHLRAASDCVRVADMCREHAGQNVEAETKIVALSEAESLLRSCIAAHPLCPIAYNNLAVLLIARGRLDCDRDAPALYADADAALRKALELAGSIPFVEQNHKLLQELRQLNQE